MTDTINDREDDPIKPRRPSNEVILTSIAGNFGATYREACDWIVEIAESLKETA